MRGLGGGINHTSEQHVKNNKAINEANVKAWKKKVKNKHDGMIKHKVWRPVRKSYILNSTRILGSVWSMKKEADGTLWDTLTAHGCSQKDGEHYNSFSIYSPITNGMKISFMLMLMLMADFEKQVIDVKGAFLHGGLQDGKKIFMTVTEG